MIPGAVVEKGRLWQKICRESAETLGIPFTQLLGMVTSHLMVHLAKLKCSHQDNVIKSVMDLM